MTRIHPFPNAKPLLLGDPEDSIGIIDTSAVAGLSGSLVMSKDLEQTPQGISGTTQVQAQGRAHTTDGLGFAVATFSNITTPTEKSVLVIVVASGTFIANQNFRKDWVIKRGATVLDTFDLQSSQTNQQSVELRTFFDTSPPAGTFTYTVNEDDVTTYGTIEVTLFFIKGTDTHAGIIATPATATKQINTPDTHTTHEREVLQ